MSSMANNLLGFTTNPNPNPNPNINNRFNSTLTQYPFLSFPSFNNPKSPHPLKISTSFLIPKALNTTSDGGAGGYNGGGGKGGSGGGGGDHEGEKDDGSSSSSGLIGLLLNGWRSRVAADPQFPFKVLMEELVGVSANVLGDMASRPNFGLNELDLVFSTLVVGSILNFLLMYILAPTAATSTTAKAVMGHMFEAGPYSIGDRLGTFVYKGAVFAVVGFAAGLVGTAISSGLVKMRKKMDPSFETGNKAPPTVLNALTWAAHMGVSCNLRYQSLNGIEYVLAKTLSPLAFKASVLVLRCLNNVMGGYSFVMLARLTGSQSQPSQTQTQTQTQTNKEDVDVANTNTSEVN